MEQQKQQGLLGFYFIDETGKDLAYMSEEQSSLLAQNITEDIKFILWAGDVHPAETGNYTFSTSDNENVALKINSKLVLMSHMSESIPLEKDKTYQIHLEYKIPRQPTHNNIPLLKLSWSYNHQPFTSVSDTCFTQPVNELQVAPIKAAENYKSTYASAPGNHNKSSSWNPYYGVDSSQFLDAFNSNIWKSFLTDMIENNGQNALPVIIKGAVMIALNLAPPPMSLMGSLIDMFQFSNTKDDAWSRTVDYVDKTIDSKISQFYKYIMASELAALSKSLEEYKRVLKIYENNNPHNKAEDPAAGVIQLFRIVNSKAEGFIEKLKQAPPESTGLEYDVLTLPLFAQAAGLHLGLLRDAIVCNWGMDKDQQQGYKVKQKKLIIEYTKHISATYKKGLENAKNKKPNYSDKDSYIQAGKKDIPVLRQWFPEVMKWNRVTTYERQMSQMTLDLAALFPLYDPDYYSIETRVVQSRGIFSPIIGIPGGLKSQNHNETFGSQVYDSKTFEQIESELYPSRASRYGGALKRIRLWTGSRNLYASSTTTSKWSTPKYGGSDGTINEIDINENNSITSVSGTAGARPLTLSFTYADGTNSQLFGATVPNGSTYADFKFEYPGYELSTMRVYDKSAVYGDADAIVFGFHRMNLEKDAQQLMTNMSSQIPAEIGIQYNLTPKTVQELINGQNAVLLNKGSAALTYTITSPRAQQYKIRYRVAANIDSAIAIYAPSSQSKTTNIPKTVANLNTIKGEYGYYQLIEGPIIEINKGANNISIKTPIGELALDNIEFVPITKNDRVVYDNFDDQRLPLWYWYKRFNIVTGGVSGKAAKCDFDGESWTYIDNQIEGHTKYTLQVKLKLNTTDTNTTQKFQLYAGSKNNGQIIKEVELKGGKDYQSFTLDFLTNDDITSTYIGFKGSGGTSSILVDDIEVIGVKKESTTKGQKFSCEKWDPYKAYKKGDKVEHQGRLFECVQDYQGQGDPTYIFALALWKLIPQ
ncbi:insecticidal delta-endotoxin Cry8Ea1 family protein [Paenibacillus sp. OSY-SE]|uniref:insecticidal delta-endotoxin Cry8Ea1 family protein n=1 Tax=Paenibacillus sp. OSY-SE TaxID=1196323 RepID=UPI0002F1C745|nr:insecticidal delta-endotoxin Cry8Ea1 family protein [Paenibacillus sp. OSY-SE]